MTNPDTETPRALLERLLTKAMNYYGMDSALNTPDYILGAQLALHIAKDVEDALAAETIALRERVKELEEDIDRLQVIAEELAGALRDANEVLEELEKDDNTCYGEAKAARRALATWDAYKGEK